MVNNKITEIDTLIAAIEQKETEELANDDFEVPTLPTPTEPLPAYLEVRFGADPGKVNGIGWYHGSLHYIWTCTDTMTGEYRWFNDSMQPPAFLSQSEINTIRDIVYSYPGPSGEGTPGEERTIDYWVWGANY